MIDRCRDLIRKCFWAFGYEVRKRVDLVDFMNSRKVDLVLDVGANVGTFEQELRTRGYDKQIVSFEPASDPYRQLAKAASADPNWQARNIALGSKAGVADINIAENSVYNSFRDQTSIAQEFDKRSTTVRTEKVSVATVDDILKDKQDRRVLLKIDTQGFERDVLAGASLSLAFILGILMEIPIVHLYEGTWTFEEVLVKMKSMGFVLAQITPTSHLKQLDPVSVAEVDCVFRRMDDNLDGKTAARGGIQGSDRPSASLCNSHAVGAE